MAWQQYLTSEPRGERRQDWHAAQLAKAVHDVALGFSGHRNSMTLEQYLLSFQALDPAELVKANLRNARAIFGKVVPAV
jgi:hypothetical protein